MGTTDKNKEPQIERVVIVGSGNVAEALARAISLREGLCLAQIYARNAERGQAVAALGGCEWTDDPSQLSAADLYLIAVSDRSVAEVAAALRVPQGAIVAHTAGSVDLNVLPAEVRRAVFYPMQTFTKGREVDFSQIPIFLETDDPALRPALETFTRKLSQTVLWADSRQRSLIHLAAVFACNFSNGMYSLGEQIVQGAGLAFDILKPLIVETAAKAAAASSPADVQTGPAARNDAQTMERQRAMLASSPELEKIYTQISKLIWEISKKI